MPSVKREVSYKDSNNPNPIPNLVEVCKMREEVTSTEEDHSTEETEVKKEDSELDLDPEEDPVTEEVTNSDNLIG